jgi:hypothetical protein
MGAPRSLCIDQKAGSVMSQEKALTDSSRPQNVMSAALLTAALPPSAARFGRPLRCGFQSRIAPRRSIAIGYV